MEEGHQKKGADMSENSDALRLAIQLLSSASDTYPELSQVVLMLTNELSKHLTADNEDLKINLRY